MIAVRPAESDADLMRVVNERLGYETRSVAIRVRGRLPLPR